MLAAEQAVAVLSAICRVPVQRQEAIQSKECVSLMRERSSLKTGGLTKIRIKRRKCLWVQAADLNRQERVDLAHKKAKVTVQRSTSRSSLEKKAAALCGRFLLGD
ncbi:hypothetical protein YK56LOC_08120 [Caballeronia sp. HLA56]